MSANHYPADAPAPSKEKPWRVTAYTTHWYWGYTTKIFVVGDFKRYWQANLVSWVYHHVLRYGCNTWRNTESNA